MSSPSAVAFLLEASALGSSSVSTAPTTTPTPTSPTPTLDSSVAVSWASSSMTASDLDRSDVDRSPLESPSSTKASSTIARGSEEFEIVVAHYNEDLSWLKPVLEFSKVYSKGGPKHAPEPCFEVELLENIGREGHTYLHHIVKYYDSLKDVTLFTQGRVDDHIELTALEMKERALKTEDGRVTTFPHRAMELFRLWDGIPWEKYPCWAKWLSPEGAFMGKRAPKTPRQYFEEFFDNFGHDGAPMSMGFQPGAIFAVTRGTIHQHPKALYQHMLEELFLGDMKAVDPETGHYFERFWPAVFRHEEYCCWDESEISKEEFNDQGQLAKGRWHETPQGVEVDVGFTNKE